MWVIKLEYIDGWGIHRFSISHEFIFSMFSSIFVEQVELILEISKINNGRIKK